VERRRVHGRIGLVWLVLHVWKTHANCCHRAIIAGATQAVRSALAQRKICGGALSAARAACPCRRPSALRTVDETLDVVAAKDRDMLWAQHVDLHRRHALAPFYAWRRSEASSSGSTRLRTDAGGRPAADMYSGEARCDGCDTRHETCKSTVCSARRSHRSAASESETATGSLKQDFLDQRMELQETHISQVFLDQRCVYKVKKPVPRLLGFQQPRTA
jgi:hypothetical protein